MLVKISKAVILLLFTVAPSLALSNTMDSFPLPNQTNTWWVAKGNTHNGHRVFIKRFKSQQKPTEIVEFYKRSWPPVDDVPGFMESEQHGWVLLSHLVPGYQWVMQVKAAEQGRGSEGLLSAMSLEPSVGANSKYLSSTRHKFTEAMSGGDRLSTTYSDKPTSARTQTHVYTGSVQHVAKRFKIHMDSKGWSLQDEYEHRNTFTQKFEKSNRQIDAALVAQGAGKTLVFFNEVIGDAN